MAQEGQVAINRRTGERAVYTNGQWVRQKAPMAADASQRGRLGMGMGPMVQAQQNMSALERQAMSTGQKDGKGQTPFSRDWGAALLSRMDIPLPFTNGEKWEPFDPIAKAWGGDDFQRYNQAAKAFESQLMPIMSGAAVSQSEAQRQIRAALPEVGDSPETLREKERTRAMMLNGAARMMGSQLPYPNVPTYGVNTDNVPQATGQTQRVRRFNPQTGKLE